MTTTFNDSGQGTPTNNPQSQDPNLPKHSAVGTDQALAAGNIFTSGAGSTTTTAAPAAAPTSGTINIGSGGGSASTDLANADTAAVGTDAQSLISAVLGDYGLQSLGPWAWDEITSGATSAQMLLDMQQTPQFQARFPAIALRQKAGLPTISPADYVNYEDSLAQMENQYGLPKGLLTNQQTVTNFIAGDTSTSEVQARVQQGYQAVTYAPPEVQQFFTQTFGVGGQGALAAHFLDPTIALPLLEQQATAAQFGGQASLGSVAMSGQDAMTLAQLGTSPSTVASGLQNIEQQQNLYDPSVTEKPLDEGTTGVEAAFGLSAGAEQQVLQAQQQRQAAFKGGGSASGDQYGQEGTGAAKTA